MFQILPTHKTKPSKVPVAVEPEINDGARLLKGHTGGITSLAFTSDSEYLLSGSTDHNGSDHSVRLWCMRDDKQIQLLQGHKGGINSVTVSSDGKRGLSGGAYAVHGRDWAYDSEIRIWDLEKGKELGRFGQDLHLVDAVEFLPDGSQAVTGSNDKERAGCLRLWNVEEFREIRRIGVHPSGVKCLAVSPCGTMAMTGSTGFFTKAHRTLRLWDLKEGEEMASFGDYRAHISAVAWSPGGSYAVSVGAEAVLWQVPEGRRMRRFEELPFGATCAALSPDSRLLLLGSGTRSRMGAEWQDCLVRVYNIADGTLLNALPGHKSGVRSVAFSPDGALAVSGDCSGEIRVWNIPNLPAA